MTEAFQRPEYTEISPKGIFLKSLTIGIKVAHFLHHVLWSFGLDEDCSWLQPRILGQLNRFIDNMFNIGYPEICTSYKIGNFYGVKFVAI
jgi:hypothetical protein